MFVNNITVKEMKRRNREAGFKFFSKNEMLKNNRQIEVSPDWLGYFVTSEVNKFGNKIFIINMFDFKTNKVKIIKDGIFSKEDAKMKLKKLRDIGWKIDNNIHNETINKKPQRTGVLINY